MIQPDFSDAASGQRRPMRLLVTRPRAEAERSAARLSALGHEALVAPLLTIVPTGTLAPEGDFAALLLTSANAVAPAAASDDLRDVPVLAVGRRTAEAALAADFAQVEHAAGDAADLARLVQARLPSGSALLHAAGRDRKPEPRASLMQAGFPVTTWEAYEARAAETLPEGLRLALAEGRLDAALHYSPRSARILISLVQEAGLIERLRRLSHICISQDVAEILRGIGAERVAAAEMPGEDSLFAALAKTAT